MPSIARRLLSGASRRSLTLRSSSAGARPSAGSPLRRRRERCSRRWPMFVVFAAALPGGSYWATISEQRETISSRYPLEDGVARELREAQMKIARQPRPGRLVGAVHRLVFGLSCWRSPATSSAVACSAASRTVAASTPGAPRRSGACLRASAPPRGAAVGPQLDDVVVREPLQHLADHRAADAEDLAQRRLGQLGARRQALLHDALEHRPVDGGLDAFARARAGSSDVTHGTASRTAVAPSHQRAVAARRPEQRHADRNGARCRGGERHAHLRQARQSGDAGDRHRPQAHGVDRGRFGIAPRCDARRRRQHGDAVDADQLAHAGADPGGGAATHFVGSLTRCAPRPAIAPRSPARRRGWRAVDPVAMGAPAFLGASVA